MYILSVFGGRMKENVKGRQIFFALLSTMLGGGIFTVPYVASRYMSTGAWISISFAASIFIIPMLLLSYSSKKYDGATLFEYSKIVLGKRTGEIYSFVFALFYLVFTALFISYFSHIVCSWILPDTSFHLVCAFIVFVCAYALSKGFIATLRLVSFVGIITVLAVVAMRFSMVFSGDIRGLFPLVEFGVVKKGFLDATVSVAVFFFGTGILAIIPHTKEQKRGFWVVSAISVGALLLILVCASCFCILGPLRTSLYPEAALLSVKAFDISSVSFIQRADIIFIITWTLLVLNGVCGICHIPYVYVKSIFLNVKEKIKILCICILIFAVAAVPYDAQCALWYINIWCKTLGFFVLFVMPTVIFALSGVRHEKKK
ncbi:MAG: hypothetical protein E7410_01770 [Ruminococcaceae bacterium]|nr:hypothetical protein [Oscillospiraceae bacterium]